MDDKNFDKLYGILLCISLILFVSNLGYGNYVDTKTITPINYICLIDGFETNNTDNRSDDLYIPFSYSYYMSSEPCD